MANGALAQQMGQLFGTGAVVAFDTPSREISALPGVDEIAPNPLQAASLAGTLTYTPPKQFVRSTPQVTQTDSDDAPAFEQSIFIEPPSLGDKGQVTDLAEFSTLSKEAVSSLGLVGLSPLSLENTFSNLLSIQDLDVTQTGIGLATQNLDPAVAAALNIATGRTVNSLTNALQNPDIFGTPAAVMKGIQTLNGLLSLDFDKIAATPDKAISSIQGLLDTFADIIENPVQSFDAFLETAGQHLEGTLGNTVHSFNFNGVDLVSITKGRGKEATREPVTTPPAMLTSFLPGPMKFAPRFGRAITNLVASIVPGPFSSIEEQAIADLETMEQAQNGISVDIGQGVGVTAGPFGSVISFNEVDIPGLGPMSFALDYARATSEYDTFLSQFDINAKLDYQSAAINNTLGALDPEEMDIVTDYIDAQMETISQVNAAAMDIARDRQAAFEQLAYNNYVDELALKDLAYTQNPELFDALVANHAATITPDQIDAMRDEIDPSKIDPTDLVAVAYLETVVNPVDFEAAMTVTEAKEAAQKTKAAIAERQRERSWGYSAIQLGSFDDGGYNSPNPSAGAIGLADTVMGITGKSTFNTADTIDASISRGLNYAANKLGYDNPEVTDYNAVLDAINTEEVGGFSTQAEFDAAVDAAFDATNDPDVAEATFDVSPEDDPTESGEGADTDDGGMSAEDAGDLGDL